MRRITLLLALIGCALFQNGAFAQTPLVADSLSQSDRPTIYNSVGDSSNSASKALKEIKTRRKTGSQIKTNLAHSMAAAQNDSTAMVGDSMVMVADSAMMARDSTLLPNDSTTLAAASALATPIKDIKREKKSKLKSDSTNKLTASTPSLDSTHVQEEIGTLDAAWKPVLINHSIGLRGGWGMGSMRREPNKEGAALPFNLWSGGVSYRFDVPEQKYVGTISFDLDYMQKGYAYLTLFNGKEAYAHKFDVIQLSVVWQPYLPLSRKHDSRVYLIAGPFVSYTLGGTEMQYNVENKEIYFNRKYEMDPMRDYYWNYGITAGLGFQIAFGRFAISVDARYNIQLSDIIRGPEHIPGNPFRTPVDHIGANLGFHYNFLKSK